MRVLVLTLHTNESELAQNRESVLCQRPYRVDHIVYTGLPNQVAHETLYRSIMKNSGSYDLFIKLDSDMVFTNDSSVKRIAEFFINDKFLDHLNLPVFDHPSGTFLMGFHCFSNRVNWQFPLDELFVDRFPDISGNRICDPLFSERVVEHMPFSSEMQNFWLGYHRASKIRQRGREINPVRSRFQLSYLKTVLSNEMLSRDTRHMILKGMFTFLFVSREKCYDKNVDDLFRESRGKFTEACTLCDFSISRIILFFALSARYVLYPKIAAKLSAIRGDGWGRGRRP